MKYTRVLVAKVALQVASEDEVFWVRKCIADGCGCEKDVANLRALAELPSTPFCVDNSDLIQIADTNKMSSLAADHIVACERCSKIGHYIANMSNPETGIEVKSLAG